jgi:flavin-binding protein dodecin
MPAGVGHVSDTSADNHTSDINRRSRMAAHTYKLIELVGTSPTSTDDAIRNAIQKASATLKHIDWFQVVETRGHVEDGRIAHFQVALKVGFRIED